MERVNGQDKYTNINDISDRLKEGGIVEALVYNMEY
jgi:hypothetical protein